MLISFCFRSSQKIPTENIAIGKMAFILWRYFISTSNSVLQFISGTNHPSH